MKSLKVTLTFWLALLFLCVMLILAVGTGIQETRHINRDLSIDMGQITEIVSDLIREKQESIFNYLSRMALYIPKKQDKAREYIRRLGLSYLPVESSFYLLDKEGRICEVFRESLKAFKGLSLENMEDVRSVITRRRPAISRIYISPFTGRRVVSMDFPSLNGWILKVELTTDLFFNLVRNIQKTIQFRLYIFNGRGDMFEHPDQSFPGDFAVMGLMTDRWNEIRKATGKLLHFRLKGVKSVGVFKSLKPFDFIVGTVVPASFITSKVFNSIVMLGSIGLISLFALAVFNFWMILYFVIHPLEEISTRVSHFEVGGEGPVLPPSLGRGFSELDLLIERFNRMGERIRTHVKEIARLESMIRNILDSSPAIVVALDADGRIWYMNRQGETFFQVTSQEIKGKRIQSLDPNLKSYGKRIKDVLTSSQPQLIRAETWLKNRMVDGTIYPLSTNGVEGVVVQWLDVSEKYRAREVYRKRLEQIFSQMDDLIYVVDKNYRIEMMNDKFAKQTKGKQADLPCYMLSRNLDKVCPDCHFPEVRGGKIVRERILNPLDKRYYDVLSIPLFNEDGSISKLTVQRDVTEYVAIQEALKASESAFRALFEGAPVGMCVHQDGKFVMVNKAMGKIVGYQPRELAGVSIFEIVHPDDREFVKKRLKKAYGEGKLAAVARERFLGKDGSTVEVLVTGIPFTYHGKKAVQTVVIDLTEQIRLQNSLLRSEAFSSQILEKALDPILVLKPQTLEILEANLPAVQFFGLPEGELIGKSYFEFVSPEELWGVRKGMKIVEAEGSISISGRHLRLPGGDCIVNLSVVQVKTPEGEDRHVVFIKDLTEFMTLQQRLAQAQKQESLWQMAGGFAHDFNNLLAIMFGYLDMMALTDDASRWKDYTRKLREVSIRARDLVQNILLFSRENRGELTNTTVDEVIFSAINLVRPALGPRHNLTIDVQNPNDVIYVDTSQMVQVILNLALNARDAIGEGKSGVISLCARRRNLSGDKAKHRGLRSGRYVEFSVEDTGPGIPEEIRDKIFDPFFTTKIKDAKKGTGLGLAIAQSIVKNFSGGIELDTTPEKTVFRVLIPLKQEGAEKPVAFDQGEAVSGEGLILVVEDEHTLQIILKEMLEELGYTVQVSDNGKEAIEEIGKGTHKPDLVILDLAMPEMGGEETMEKMMQIHSDLKVIIMSGLVDNDTQTRLLKKGAMAFVKKPVTITGLSRIIHRVMLEQ